MELLGMIGSAIFLVIKVVLALFALLTAFFGYKVWKLSNKGRFNRLSKDELSRFHVPVDEDTPEARLRSRLTDRLAQLVAEGEWDKVHAHLNDWDEQQSSLPTGYRLSDLGVTCALAPLEEALDAAFKIENITPLLRQYEDRHRADPTDLAAACLAARAHVMVGWVARGDGFADSVTEEGARGFVEHHQAAEDILAPLEGAYPNSGMLAQTRYRTAIANRDADKLLPRLYDAWVQADPYDPDAYRVHGFHLLPRWFGSHEQLIVAAKQAIGRTQDQWGTAVYAMMVLEDLDCEPDLAAMIEPDVLAQSVMDAARVFPCQTVVNELANALMLLQVLCRAGGHDEAADIHAATARKLVETHLTGIVPDRWVTRAKAIRKDLAHMFEEELRAGQTVVLGQAA